MPNRSMNRRMATNTNSTVVAPVRRAGRWVRMGASGGPAGPARVDGEPLVHQALPVDLGRQGVRVEQGERGPADVVVGDGHPDAEPLVLDPRVRVGVRVRRGRLDELELD